MPVYDQDPLPALETVEDKLARLFDRKMLLEEMGRSTKIVELQIRALRHAPLGMVIDYEY